MPGRRDSGGWEAWLAVLEWLAVIGAGTSVPGPEHLHVGPLDKALHFAGSAVLGFLSFRALRSARSVGRPVAALGTGLAVGLVTTAGEQIQAHVPRRHPSLGDLAAGVVGGLTGGMAAALTEPPP